MTEYHPLDNHAPGSLRGRLIRRLAVLLALILLVSSLSAYWSARHAADTAYDRTLLATAKSIGEQLSLGEVLPAVDVPLDEEWSAPPPSSARLDALAGAVDGFGLVHGPLDLTQIDAFLDHLPER